MSIRAIVSFGLPSAGPLAFAQLDQSCVIGILNRTVPVNADGTWVLSNIPAKFGPVRGTGAPSV